MPRSDEDKAMAINTAKRVKDYIPPANMPLTLSTQAWLDSVALTLRNADMTIRIATVNQKSNKLLTDKAFAKAKMFISHYFQAFNNGVDRGLFHKSNRALFGLAANSDAVPVLTSKENIRYWGGQIASGDAERIAQGGAAMSNPSAAEVKEAVDDFILKNSALNANIGVLNEAKRVLKKLRPEIKRLIKQIWNEVEVYCTNQTASARRSYGRRWGIVYVSDVINTIKISVVNKTNGERIPKALITVLQSKKKYTADTNGNLAIKTTVKKKITLDITMKDFEPAEVIIKFNKKLATYVERIELNPIVTLV